MAKELLQRLAVPCAGAAASCARVASASLLWNHVDLWPVQMNALEDIVVCWIQNMTSSTLRTFSRPSTPVGWRVPIASSSARHQDQEAQLRMVLELQALLSKKESTQARWDGPCHHVHCHCVLSTGSRKKTSSILPGRWR